MGINIGQIDSGRDTNVTMYHGLPVPDDWRVQAIEAMAEIDDQDIKDYVDAKTRQLSQLLMNGGSKTTMRDVVSAIKDLAPGVAAVITSLMPFLKAG